MRGLWNDLILWSMTPMRLLPSCQMEMSILLLEYSMDLEEIMQIAERPTWSAKNCSTAHWLDSLAVQKRSGKTCRGQELEGMSFYKCWPVKCTPPVSWICSDNRDQSGSIPQTPSQSQQAPLFPQASQPATQPSTQQPAGLPSDLQSQLASITAGLPGGGPRREYMSLNDVLTRDVLKRVLEMPGIAEQLRPGMPENWEAEGGSGVEEVIQSPQFQQVSHRSRPINGRHSHRSHRP